MGHPQPMTPSWADGDAGRSGGGESVKAPRLSHRHAAQSRPEHPLVVDSPVGTSFHHSDKSGHLSRLRTAPGPPTSIFGEMFGEGRVDPDGGGDVSGGARHLQPRGFQHRQGTGELLGWGGVGSGGGAVGSGSGFFVTWRQTAAFLAIVLMVTVLLLAEPDSGGGGGTVDCDGEITGVGAVAAVTFARMFGTCEKLKSRMTKSVATQESRALSTREKTQEHGCCEGSSIRDGGGGSGGGGTDAPVHDRETESDATTSLATRAAAAATIPPEPGGQPASPSPPPPPPPTAPPGSPRVALVQIPKTGSTSYKRLLPQILPPGAILMYDTENCYRWVVAQKPVLDAKAQGIDIVSTTLLREPRSHVLSMFMQCYQNTYKKAEYSTAFHRNASGDFGGDAEMQELSRRVNSFRAWITNFAAWNRGDQDFQCYVPINLQARQLTCPGDRATDEPYAPAPVIDSYQSAWYVASTDPDPQDGNLAGALAALDEISVTGVLDALEETACMVHYKVTGGVLHPGCECGSSDGGGGAPSEAVSMEAKRPVMAYHERHGLDTLHYDVLPDDLQEMVDAVTRVDDEVYRAAVQRLLIEVGRVESATGKIILCAPRRKTLEQLASSPRFTPAYPPSAAFQVLGEEHGAAAKAAMRAQRSVILAQRNRLIASEAGRVMEMANGEEHTGREEQGAREEQTERDEGAETQTETETEAGIVVGTETEIGVETWPEVSFDDRDGKGRSSHVERETKSLGTKAKSSSTNTRKSSSYSKSSKLSSSGRVKSPAKSAAKPSTKSPAKSTRSRRGATYGIKLF